MFQITLDELAKVVEGQILPGPLAGDQMITGISIDSRNISQGNLFVAIPGDRFDGHQFTQEAVAKGAQTAVIAGDKRETAVGEVLSKAAVVLVEDTKKALRKLASWYKRKFDIPTVVVTGTNGKTTTKDMIAEVLSSRYRVQKSPQSYNNLVGVPLTLFQLNSRSEALVLELGMSSPNEIGILTKIANPDVGVITNIGPAHLESMGSVERIARAKFELPENMSPPGTLILNADDPILARRIRQKKQDERTISFGIESQADFAADRIGLNGDGHINFRVNKDLSINLRLLGTHNVYNALAAFAVGRLKEVDPQKIKQSLEKYEPSYLRMELVRIGNIRVINDSYNANPISMEKALDTLKSIRTSGRKVAVLGDMLELGENASEFHLEVGSKVAQSGVDFLIVVGALARFIGAGAREAGMSSDQVLTFDRNEQVSLYLLQHLRDGDLLLVKGSRKMKTEEVVLSLKAHYARQN
ncbi:MAG: UDP-N-acetylmuramoyl-tripeptide--D-alanyl-D-alanine ligase [Candidatus Zixiibacteriota bacterium]|nr:MAG: UDP-N-acetylmuramoyl-tripeptide--D-alanyl-D-alanine ligase [candidate division Zixibacteria bacterium]